jgi:hypothetical protein
VHHADGLLAPVAAVDVDEQLRLRADGGARLPHAVEVAAGVGSP